MESYFFLPYQTQENLVLKSNQKNPEKEPETSGHSKPSRKAKLPE